MKIALILAALLAIGCDSYGPSALCRSDVVVAVAPAERRISWLLPAGVTATAIEVTVNGNTSRVGGAVTSITVDDAIKSVSVRAQVCGQWGEWYQ